MQSNIPSSDNHLRPKQSSNKTVEAVGKLSEALETIERARGRLYDFHQLSGHADLQVGEAVDQLRAAGHNILAKMVEEELVGLNVIPGRWTFQIVEEYDDGYYKIAKNTEETTRKQLLKGKRHVFESEMKENRRTKGKKGHEARP